MSIDGALYHMCSNDLNCASKSDFDHFVSQLLSQSDHFLKQCVFYDRNPELISQRVALDKEYVRLLSSDSTVTHGAHRHMSEFLLHGFVRSKCLLGRNDINILRSIAKRSYLFSLKYWNVRAYGGYTEDESYKYFDILRDTQAPYWIVDPAESAKLLGLVEKILGSRGLLPPKSFRVDNINFSHLNNSTQAGGIYWHKDAAGHAIRYFFTIHSTGVSPSTSVIPYSHLLPSCGILVDFIRSMYTCRQFTNISDITPLQLDAYVESYLQSIVRSQSLSLNQTTGSVSAWDFNTFHRATQPAVHESDMSWGSRTVLIVDFMPINSSNFIADRNLAPCAPGQVPILFDRVPCSSYIDKDCLQDNYHGYLYAHRSHLNKVKAQLVQS